MAAMPRATRHAPSPRPLVLGALCVAALLCVAHDAAANPLDAFGWGARASGLAGAATAVVDDFSANYYNPAALASDDRLRFDLGYSLVEPRLQLNDADLDVDQSRGVHGGIIIPGDVFGHILAFSVGVFLPDERITRIRALPQGQPRFVVYDNRPQRIVITTSLAFEVLEGLFVGAGLTYVANTKGTLKIDGIVDLVDVENTELQTAVDVALDSVRYASAGILWKPDEHWRLGLTFRDEFHLEIALELPVEASIVLGSLGEIDRGTLDVTAVDANLFSPRQVFFGAAYEAERWLVSFDFGWQQWSRFPAPTAEIDIEIDLETLDFDIPAPDRPLDPDFHDIFVTRLGAEGAVFDGEHVRWDLRGGYGFEPSPAPDQPGLTNYVDAHKHTLALGSSVRLSGLTEVLPGPVSFDLAGLLIVLDERTYEKRDPADPVGSYTASGYLGGFTATTRVLF